MNDVLKQRLVGALILVALGVVFWPIIFVEPEQQGSLADARIPPRPSVARTSIEPPDLAGLRPSKALKKAEEVLPEAPLDTPVLGTRAKPKGEVGANDQPKPQSTPIAELPSKAPSNVPIQGKTRLTAPVKPSIDADGIPVAWILRVASVSSGTKADSLRRQLLKMGHKAYRQKVKSGGKTLYRVYVGPKVERVQLEKIQTQINREFGVTTMITRYYP